MPWAALDPPEIADKRLLCLVGEEFCVLEDLSGLFRIRSGLGDSNARLNENEDLRRRRCGRTDPLDGAWHGAYDTDRVGLLTNRENVVVGSDSEEVRDDWKNHG